MRRRFDMCIYGYVVMPEHIHLLLSEPGNGTLAAAIHYLKLSCSKRARRTQVSPTDGRTWGTMPNLGSVGCRLVGIVGEELIAVGIIDHQQAIAPRTLLDRNSLGRKFRAQPV